MEQKKKRQSGIELLRIIAMLLIIAHHYSDHGGFGGLTLENVGVQRYFLQVLLLFGRPACSIFALITGFFLIQVRDTRSHYRKLGFLYGQRLFYGVVLLLIAVLLKLHIGRSNCVSSVLPFTSFNWYILYYILLYMLVPFLNPMLRSLSKRQFTWLVALLFFAWSIMPSLNLLSSAFKDIWGFSNIDFFLVMYAFGAYIRLHVHEKVRYDNRWNLFAGILLTLMLCALIFAVDCSAVRHHDEAIFGKVATIRRFNFPLCVAWAVSLFLYFSRLNINPPPFVHRVAATTLGIYLIHDHPMIRNLIWEVILPNVNYVDAPYLHAIVKIFAVFIICAAIELLRAATVGKWFNRRFSKVYDWALDRLDARRSERARATN